MLNTTGLTTLSFSDCYTMGLGLLLSSFEVRWGYESRLFLICGIRRSYLAVKGKPLRAKGDGWPSMNKNQHGYRKTVSAQL